MLLLLFVFGVCNRVYITTLYPSGGSSWAGAEVRRMHAVFAYRSAQEQNCRVLFQPTGGDDDLLTYTLLLYKDRRRKGRTEADIVDQNDRGSFNCGVNVTGFNYAVNVFMK